MKNLYAVAAFTLLVAGSASAGETGIINQAGPYEAQMRFYLHPAHGFPAVREAVAQGASGVDSKPSAEGAKARSASASTPVRASNPTRNRSDRLTVLGRS